MVAELTKISKEVKKKKQKTKKTEKPRRDMDGENWRELKSVDCIWVNLKNLGPPFFKFLSVYIKMSFTQLENHSQLLCGRDFVNERLLLCQFDV